MRHIMGIENGTMKLIFRLKDRKLLGVHIVGEAVLNLDGGIDYFIENTFNYPTLAEGYRIAALDAYNEWAVESLRRSKHPTRAALRLSNPRQHSCSVRKHEN
jgi:hypothetical protein